MLHVGSGRHAAPAAICTCDTGGLYDKNRNSRLQRDLNLFAETLMNDKIYQLYMYILILFIKNKYQFCFYLYGK